MIYEDLVTLLDYHYWARDPARCTGTTSKRAVPAAHGQ